MSLIVIITFILFAIIGRVYLVFKLTGSFGVNNTFKSIRPNFYYIVCLYIGFNQTADQDACGRKIPGISSEF